MHGHSRLGMAAVPSPPNSPRHRHFRTKSASGDTFCGGGGGGASRRLKVENFVEHLVCVVLLAVLRRRGLLLLAPLLYISGMLMYMGSLSFDVKNGGAGGDKASLPGSIYRSPQLFHKLWPYMRVEDNGGENVLMAAWDLKLHKSWKPCKEQNLSKAEFAEQYKSNGFLIIEANGGLNQQRLSISDAVAVAGLLNATLVIPTFHLNSVWKDSSKFRDIFDEDFFVNSLHKHVNVVRELPNDILQRFDNNISKIVNLRVKAWSSPEYYLQKVLPKLVELGAVRIAPFSNRLAHAVSSNIQGLRCLANFNALKFSQPIHMLAQSMVDRMVQKSSHSGGKYVSVHLRFEEDMVAFSCCIYDGGEKEKREMDIAREKGWRGKFLKKGRIIKPGSIRMDGKCPLTPLEVGMMLRGMGFDNTTSVYVASGKIYNAEKYMAPLKQLFPHLETKETLATEQELGPFKGHSSRLAALDYTVCLNSEVFVTTQGGNFPHFLMGHRRYIYGGHAKTINPDKRKLALIFDRPDMRWETFRQQMRGMLRHSDLKGSEVRKPSNSLYTFPMPDCMCEEAIAEYSNKTINFS